MLKGVLELVGLVAVCSIMGSGVLYLTGNEFLAALAFVLTGGFLIQITDKLRGGER